MANNNLSKVSLIFDNSGAIYMAHLISEHPEYYLIYNPAQVFYKLNDETKEIEINILPVCAPELMSETAKKEGSRWVYKKSNARFVSTDDGMIDIRIIEHYHKVFDKVNSM